MVPQEHVAEPFTWAGARLYRVELGMGYLELPQPDAAPLARAVLHTRNVYVLDAHVDVFVWYVHSYSTVPRGAGHGLPGAAAFLYVPESREPSETLPRLRQTLASTVRADVFEG